MEDKYLLPDWKDKNKLERILFIISLIFAILVIVSIIITMVTKYKLYFISYTFIFLFLIVQGIQYWKYNKPMAIIEFICSIIFLIAEIVMFIK